MDPSSDSPDRHKRSTIDPSLLGRTQEKLAPVATGSEELLIGVPLETHHQENRVALTPAAVGVLTANGHTVMVEHKAGESAQFTDQDYSEQGAKIAYSAEQLYKESKIIAKVTPLAPDEYDLVQEDQVLISAVHLGDLKRDYIEMLKKKNVTAFGFEFIQAQDESIPVMLMMSEIAGVTSIHIASELLSVHTGGKGLLLGGITGIPPAVVTIIGAGTVGFHACKAALGFGATVKVVDLEVYKLRQLEQHLGRKVFTAISHMNYIEEAVASSDVVIGAVYHKGHRTPCVVTEDMVMNMREGSVIIDVSIDQGGCIETSRMTSHTNPTYVKHGVVHYCVPNIASRVSRTASIAISNILTTLLYKIGEAGGVNNMLGMERGVKHGIYTYRRHITEPVIANMFGLNYMDINLLHATTNC